MKDRSVASRRAGRLTHLSAKGDAVMVDVAGKPPTRRRAVAAARVLMRAATARLIGEGRVPKGDVLATARVAGIMAAKRTPDLIPLCHPLSVTRVEVDLAVDVSVPAVLIRAVVEAFDRTGVEMEALTAASVAGLTIIDMVKGVDRELALADVVVLEKSGGRSGHYVRQAQQG